MYISLCLKKNVVRMDDDTDSHDENGGGQGNPGLVTVLCEKIMPVEEENATDLCFDK